MTLLNAKQKYFVSFDLILDSFLKIFSVSHAQNEGRDPQVEYFGFLYRMNTDSRHFL